MYPAHFFSLYPPFPRENKVFVAMSFDARFDARWLNVIAPAVRQIVVNDKALEPVRVDTRHISDSILTEILDGISNSRLIFADVTTMGVLGDKFIRNGNVMYEIGMAQATRLPEEVLLFRSDSDPLLFDTSTVRVNFYDPDASPEEARSFVADAMLASLNELELRRHLAVRKAADMLDIPCWDLLGEACANKTVEHPAMRTMLHVLGNSPRAAAITRLLEMGALRTAYVQVTPELITQLGDKTDYSLLRYKCTEFGRAVWVEGASRLGVLTPEIAAALGEIGGGALPA